MYPMLDAHAKTVRKNVGKAFWPTLRVRQSRIRDYTLGKFDELERHRNDMLRSQAAWAIERDYWKKRAKQTESDASVLERKVVEAGHTDLWMAWKTSVETGQMADAN